MSKLLNISWLEIKNAIAISVITFMVTVTFEVVAAGTIWGLDWRTIGSDGIIAALSFIGAFLTAFLTTSKGNLAGVTKIK